MNQYDIIADHIKSRLDNFNIDAVRADHEVKFEVDETLFTIVCTKDGSWIHDGYSTYGRYCYYSDPDFYFMVTRTVRMIVNPTPILYIYGPHQYMLSILSE